jgi:hypothetical protein
VTRTLNCSGFADPFAELIPGGRRAGRGPTLTCGVPEPSELVIHLICR